MDPEAAVNWSVQWEVPLAAATGWPHSERGSSAGDGAVEEHPEAAFGPMV